MDADSSLLLKGSRDDVKRDAERPLHSCLDVGRVEQMLGRDQPTLAEDLSAIQWAF